MTASTTPPEDPGGLPWRLLPAAAVLSVVAVFNRFPLTYFDTGGYIKNAYAFAHGLHPPTRPGPFINPFFYRPVTYSLFLTPFATPATLWLLPLAQGLVVAYCMHLALRSAGVTLSSRGFLLLAAVLAAGTSLPWFTGQVMPDIFTSVLVLLTFVALWGGDRLNVWEKTAVAVLVTLSVASHLSHLPIYAGVLVVGVVWRTRVDGSGFIGPHLVLRTLGPLVIAVTGLVASNWMVNGKPVISESSDLFYLARLVGDGTAQRYLAGACHTRAYLLCAERDSLKTDSDWFLWDPKGPWQRYQQNPIFLTDANDIVRGTLRERWPRQILASVWHAPRQLLKFGTEPGWHRSEVEVAPALAIFGESTLAAYRASPQARRALPLALASAVQITCVGLALLLLIRCIPILVARGQHALLALIGLVFAGVVVNAVVMAALSSVNPRYESRVIWLIPFVACIAAAEVAGMRRPGSLAEARR